MVLKLTSNNLSIQQCPHCGISNPTLEKVKELNTNNHTNEDLRRWAIYRCNTCGGLVTAWAHEHNMEVKECFPSLKIINETIPDRPRAYLQQAITTKHAPAGAVMLAASAVDAMLKIKGYTEGTLYSRIQKAATDHLITSEMAEWAHEVRLDANDQRHADENAALPDQNDAERVIDFAEALAEILFVLPQRVKRGRENTQGS